MNQTVDTLKVEIGKEFQTIIAGCSSEQKAADAALQKVQGLREKVEDLEATAADKQLEAEGLRAEITDLVAGGKDATKQISKRSALLAECQVIVDIIEDIREEKIPSAESEAQRKLEFFQEKAIKDLQSLKQTYQDRISQLAGDMANLVEAWGDVLDSFVNENGSLVKGKTGSPFVTDRMRLRFPQIAADTNPFYLRTQIERGEL